MSALRIRTGSRLHFGLLGWGPDLPRQFGGVGLMIDEPGLAILARPALRWQAEGPHCERCLRVARSVGQYLESRGLPVPCVAFTIEQAPGEHIGLGTGTQLSLAVARLLAQMAGLPTAEAPELALWTGRGQRSGIGLHGFDRGGLIVDGGRGRPDGVPPLIARPDFPGDWNILVVVPELALGRHGAHERSTFESLPAVPRAISERLCRLLLTGILPAVAETDLPAFGAALAEFQQLVGTNFAPAQGGVFAHPMLASLAERLRYVGLQGVGQSSWGPALYGFTNRSPDSFQGELTDCAHQFGLAEGQWLWTRARNQGAVVTVP
jgi:beta-RFAP synthase